MNQRNSLAAYRCSISIFFAVVAFFATSIFAQDTAHIPFKFNVDVIVTATQGERVITQEFKANTLDTLRLHLGTTPLLSQGTVSKPVTMHNSRGKLSLELSPQFYRNTEISIYTLSGKRVLHDRVEAAKNISHLNLATGVYLLHIKGGSSTFSTRVAHQGGGMNIEVGFGSVSSLNKEHLGVWTITVTAKDKETHLDLTYTITAETGVHATHTINSNGSSFTRQPSGGGNPVVVPPVTPPAPTALMECDANKLAVTKSANAFAQSDIICWVGEKSGTNKAMLIFNWNDGKDALAYGYRWSGTKHGINILADVAKADGRLFYLELSGTQFGSAVGGVGYNESGSANAKLSNDGGATCKSPVNGSIGASSYDFDNWKLCPASSNARFKAGWYENYWSYWVADAAGEWSYSGLGASSRELKNNSIDAWYFSPLGEGATIGQTDCKGKDCFDKITPASPPASYPVVTPSSSSVVIVTPSSSSVVVTPSSSSSRESCEGFEDGTEREHHGKNKHQFCDVRDGKKYVYVDMGGQNWMAENLNYAGENGNLGTCVQSSEENCTIYGRLYQRNEIECPAGWHLPTTTEVEALLTHSDPNFVPGGEMGIGRNTAAVKLKVKGWQGSSDDEYGFSAKQSGPAGSGTYSDRSQFDKTIYWWSDGYGAPTRLGKSWRISQNDASDNFADSPSDKAVDDSKQSNLTTRFYARCVQEKKAIAKAAEPSPAPPTCTGTKPADQECHYSKYKDYFEDDRDNNKRYHFVNIGRKNWMAENLNYNVEGSKCYNDIPGNCEIYGRLYNHKTALDVCPTGWRLPTDAEWTELTDAIGGLNGTATKLKAGSGWSSNGTDNYGFAALPGGYGNLRNGSEGSFVDFGSARGGFWWSATTYAANGAYLRHIGPTLADVNRIDNDVSRLYSVRCVSEGNFCGGKPYEKATHFCQEGKAIQELCNGKEYKSTEFCQKVTEKVLPLCNGETHEYEKVCIDNKLVMRDCSDFNENPTPILHQGRSKARFCDSRDGQKYVYVNMGGDAIWMAENLNYEAEGTSRCYNDATGGDSQKNCEKYGRLYTWKTASDEICPAGWHLPTRAEWNALGGVARDLKTNSGWNANGIDIPPGFSALPGGRMTFTIQDATPSFETNFAFSNAGSYGNWWSADKKDNNNVYYLQMNDANSVMETSTAVNTGYNREGFSVRCVRDTKCEGTECEKEIIDPALKPCGEYYYDDRKNEFCWEKSKVGTFCGDNSKEYDPDLYECKPKINPNGIFLIKDRPVDRAGNVYEAVKIGEQVWMAENLKINVEGSECRPEANYCDIYGRLYSWSTANSGICPEGWHIPSTTEWSALFKTVNNDDTELKAKDHWTKAPANLKGKDFYGFAALPAGAILMYMGQDYGEFGEAANWWAATNLDMFYMHQGTSTTRQAKGASDYKYSVRCLKN